MQKPGSGEQGFTLIELLVALVILGLMSGILAGSIGFSAIVGSKARASSAETDEVVHAQRILRSRIEQLVPAVNANSGSAIVDIDGSPALFAFMAPPPGRLEPDALRRYRVQLNPGNDLVLRSISSLDTDGSEGRFEETVLLRDVAQVRIAYFGSNSRWPGRRWLGFWRDQPQPPELIRVSVDFRAGDGRRFADLVVRPRSSVNSLCRISQLTGRCESDV